MEPTLGAVDVVTALEGGRTGGQAILVYISYVAGTLRISSCHHNSYDTAALRLCSESQVYRVSTRDEPRWEHILNKTCAIAGDLVNGSRCTPTNVWTTVDLCWEDSTKGATTSSKPRFATHDPLVKMAPYVAENTKPQQHPSLSPKSSPRLGLCSTMAPLPLPKVSAPPVPPAANPSLPPTPPASSSPS